MAFFLHKKLTIRSRMRKELSRPFGKRVKTEQLAGVLDKKSTVYAIGDVTVASLLELGYAPKISIFDYRTKLGEVDFPIIRANYKNPVRVRNRRGTISAALWEEVRKASCVRGKRGIRVFGEEDLAALVCLHFAKIGDVVIYGMRDKGMSFIRVDKGIKKYVDKVLSEMSVAD